MLLVDTSAWVEVFRRPSRLDLGDYGGLDEIVTCLPVIQEVLQGFRDEGAFRVARDAMLALPIVESPLSRERFLDAAALYRDARRAGWTVRSAVDCLIAACALRHGLTVLHRDRDFTLLAKVSPLSERNVAA
ncbi:MAG: type II toxin-antitoxin system VapC family toxin [Candidatus Binatia bacterium]